MGVRVHAADTGFEVNLLGNGSAGMKMTINGYKTARETSTRRCSLR